MAYNDKADCINGELRPGDLVVSIPEDDYDCLVGRVIEIHPLGTPEHDAETDNDTDDVHVDFLAADYSVHRKAEIAAMFTELYGQTKTFDECPLDDTIMSPDSLIRITDIRPRDLEELLDSREKAVNYCSAILNQAPLRQLLIERLKENFDEYRDHIVEFPPWAIFDMAARIAHTQEVHDQLIDRYGFREGQIEYLLRFRNPLEVVTDAWEVQRADIADLDFIMHSLCDRQDALADYPLYTTSKEKPAVEQKPSIMEQLRNAANDAKNQPPKQTGPSKDDETR